MPQIDEAPAFDILINERDEILIAIDEQSNEPDEPMVIIDQQKVVLARSTENILDLPGIPDELIKQMLECESVLIAEANDEGLVREYMAIITRS